MSLKAWYPFNGNYNNQGVGALNLTQVTSPTYVTGGKVCNQTLSTGAFKWTADQTNSILNNKAISIAFWIKALNSNDGGPIFGTTSMAPPNNRRFTLYTYPKMNDFHWSWQNEDSSNASNGGTISGCFPTGVWTHCCITYDGQTGTAIAYINGVEKSKTANKYIQNSTYAYETPVIHNNSNRHIQDFRVYDHCLAPREVKQLSQGLFLHYKLSDGITQNLISSLESGGRTSLSGTHSFNANFYENVDTYAWINVSPALELNKTYTLSFDVSNFPTGSRWTWQLWNSANYAFAVDSNGHYSYTFKVEAAKLSSDYSLTRFLFDDGGRTGPANVVTFSNFKLEEGDTDTIWTPNANIDYLNYESDCSGYRLNGTRVGAVKNSLSTGRYKQSRKFDNNQYIYCSRTMTMTDATISAWLKIDTYPSSGYMVAFADQVSKIAFGFYNGNSAIISCGDSTNNSLVIVDLKSKWDLSKWHLVTITKKGSDYKFYFDGKLWTNLGSSNYWTMTATNTLCIGCRNNGSYTDFYKGFMSDFRIYATALNETDIKILYDSSLSFLENAVFQAYSVEDASVHNIKMTEQGILKSGNFSEIGYIGGMKIKVLSDGSAWARIHWLDVTNEQTWFTTNEVQFCNASNRFSRMGLVDHFKSNKLPKGYQKLNYIESTGTQYIDTGYYWTSEITKIYMDATVISNSANQSLFGNEEPFSGGRYFSIVPHGSNGSYGYYVGSNAPLKSGIATCTVGTRFNMECTTDANKLFTLKINDTIKTTGTYSGTVMAYTNTTSTAADRGRIYIFCNHNSSSGGVGPIQNVGGMRLYSFKMYDNGKIVRDFVPCKNSSGTVGLFDMVYQTFYSSPNGAAFTASLGSVENSGGEGVYEFMLTHPRISSTLYNRWIQSSSPNATSVTGFKNITQAWSQANAGIRKNGSSCVYNCDSGSTWYAPIGQTAGWTSGGVSNQIPAANETKTTEIELWVRIDNLNDITKISMLDDKYLQAFEIKEI